MAAVPASRRALPTRKRYSPIRLSTDTTATLPEYSDSRVGALPRQWAVEAEHSSPSEQPPDYPDSADEADEETDDFLPAPVLLSPRRLRRIRSVTRAQKNHSLYSGKAAAASDSYLDSLLERSVNALELSNTLLQSSMSTQSNVSMGLASETDVDQSLESRARRLNSRIRSNKNVHDAWVDDLDDFAKGVENMYQDEPDVDTTLSHSLPTAGLSLPPHRKHSRRPSLGSHRTVSDGQRSRKTGSYSHPPASAPPNVSSHPVGINPPARDVFASSSNVSLAFVRSTPEYRTSSHSSEYRTRSSRSSSTVSTQQSFHQIDSSPSPSPSPSSRSETLQSQGKRGQPNRRGSSGSRSRSRSWSRSSDLSITPNPISRNIPTPIPELPSQSDSSSSSNSHLAAQTVESLRKILDELPIPANAKGKGPLSPRSPSFSPRSPPVMPVVGISTTTTSISRLLKRGTHSTTTRASSPPKQSSLKRPPGSLLTVNTIVDGHSSSPSRVSSGRSTPRQVAFGPLPEPYSSSREGESSYKSVYKRRSRSKTKGKAKVREGESSWWKAWLIGRSELSMTAAKHEEKAEERFARSWGRPAMGSGLEDWSI